MKKIVMIVFLVFASDVLHAQDKFFYKKWQNTF